MPGPKCFVEHCNNNSYKSKVEGTNFAFHRFPKDTGLKNKWLRKCGRNIDFGSEFAFVCSAHFTTDDYVRDMQAELLGYVGRRKLKPHAVPSVNLPYEKKLFVSAEEEAKKAKEKHNKIIEDCLNKSGDQRSVLSFDLFKKMKYKKNKKPRNISKSGVYLLKISPSELSGQNSKNGKYARALNDQGIEISDYIMNNKNLVYFSKGSEMEGSSMDDLSRMTDPVIEVDKTSDDPVYLKEKIDELCESLDSQRKLICKLKRGILREKKMTEKIMLATNAGIPIEKRRSKYNQRARNALLNIYSLSPNNYSQFSKALNLPDKNILSTWDSEVCPPVPLPNTETFNNEVSENNLELIPEEEYIVEEVQVEE